MNTALLSILLAAAMALSCSGCTTTATAGGGNPVGGSETILFLSDQGVTVDGASASTDPTAAVYVGSEIVYYHDGTDESYGEGTAQELHSAAEADAHTVVTITQPGTYRLSGTLSQGQIAVDLGTDAVTDPTAVVTLLLDNIDVTCTVAPALLFYNVYECGTTDNPSPNVDTTAAGANVILTQNSVNTFTGSHVARIYKEGTTKKLHKYDGAFYSRMSMNISGEGGSDSGVLNIIGDNEGLNSELHLTLNSGTVNIQSQDDGINTNEDGVSVTTLNGGVLTINAGLGAEGDGIDSNGYLTINGGTLYTMSNETSPDGGIDADGAITVNGGTVYAFGIRNDTVDRTSAQPCMELSFASTLPAGSVLKVTDETGKTVLTCTTQKVCQSVTLSSADLVPDTAYQVYVDDVLQGYSGNQTGRMGGGQTPPELPDGESGMGVRPEDGQTPPERPDGTSGKGQRPDMGNFPDGSQQNAAASTNFTLTDTVQSFSGIQAYNPA